MQGIHISIEKVNNILISYSQREMCTALRSTDLRFILSRDNLSFKIELCKSKTNKIAFYHLLLLCTNLSVLVAKVKGTL